MIVAQIFNLCTPKAFGAGRRFAICTALESSRRSTVVLAHEIRSSRKHPPCIRWHPLAFTEGFAFSRFASRDATSKIPRVYRGPHGYAPSIHAQKVQDPPCLPSGSRVLHPPHASDLNSSPILPRGSRVHGGTPPFYISSTMVISHQCRSSCSVPRATSALILPSQSRSTRLDCCHRALDALRPDPPG